MFDTGAVIAEPKNIDQLIWPHSYSGFPDYDPKPSTPPPKDNFYNDPNRVIEN